MELYIDGLNIQAEPGKSLRQLSEELGFTGQDFSARPIAAKIAGEIRRVLRDDGAVEVGRVIREQGQTLYSARERLRQQLGREPALSELSEATGFTPEEIAHIELATDTPESLQQETAEGLPLEGTLGTEAP